MLIDFGADREDIDAELTRHRAELRVWRDEALARMHAWLADGGGSVLH